MGVSNLGDLVATAQLDISPFIGNSRQLQLYLRGVDKALKTSESSVKGYSDKLSGLKQVYNQTGMALNDYRKLLEKQTVAFNNAKKEAGDLETANEKQKQTLVATQSAMMATASRVAELQNKYNALGKEIASLSSGWMSFGNELVKSGNELTKIGQKASGVGKALTLGLTTPIVTGVGYITKLAIEYESAFAGVKKTVDETTTTSYEKLSSDIREMSKILPATASDIAKVAEVAGQLGIKADDITDFTKVMIDLGESTNLSATTAAESLAKFANITKLAPENYSRLGASIVDLGNNFATTEADITAMASRLAGAGAQIGLSQADIIGLAGALSSVGIEAEMGGSSFSKLMVKMQLASTSGAKGMDELTAKTGLSRRELELMLANSSSKFKKLANSIGMTSTEMGNIVKASANLEDFARISGMTADEFVQKFEKDAVGAIGAFINGLGNAEESGESAIEMLNEMGFTEVRLRDSLLRAGNAQDLFSRAVDMSNEAWEENTALTNEANKRYETTEAKLKMLRNEAVDTAIEFGGPLVDALRESLDTVKPWIRSASEMAKAFNNLDKEQQRQTIMWGLIAAGIGPASTAFGKVTSVIGATHKGLGTMIKAIGSASTALKAGTPIVEALGASSAVTAGSATGLAGAISTLGSPLTWGVLLGGASLLGIGIIASEIGNARLRTEEWGTEVDKVQASELNDFKNKVDETTKAMELFGKKGKQDVESIQQAVKDLVSEITLLADEKLAKDVKLAEQLGLSENVINALKKSADDSKQYVQRVSDEMLDIYKRHAKDHTQLSAEEQQLVLQYQTDLINEQLELMNYSSEERIAIQKAMNGELVELNKTQLDNVFEQTTQWMADENKAYKERRNNLKETLSQIKGDSEESVRAREEILAEIETLEANHNAVMDTYQQKFVQIMREKWEREKEIYKDRPDVLSAYEKAYRDVLESYGMSWEEFVSTSAEGVESVASDYDYLGQIVKGMTDEAVEANARWESLVWNEKEQKLKTNVEEVLQKAVESESGWNDLNFILKNATIDSNARELIVEAMSSSEAWNGLTINEKQLVIDGNEAMIEIVTSTTLLDQWMKLTPEQKQLLAVDLTKNPTESAQTAINKVKQLTPAEIKATNKTGIEAQNATKTLNSVVQKFPAPIYASNKTGAGVEEAKRSIAGVEGRTVDIWVNLKKGASTLWNAIGWATGTNYHPGGFAMVNDQKGSVYRELVTLPNGNSFVPEGRDVILPLPKGSKVLKASDTKKLFPRYADGIGFENTRIARLTERMRAIPEEKITATYQSDNSEVKQLLARLLELTGQGTELMSQIVRGVNDIYDKDSYMVLDNGTLVAETGDKFAKHFSSIERRNKRLRGVPYD